MAWNITPAGAVCTPPIMGLRKAWEFCTFFRPFLWGRKKALFVSSLYGVHKEPPRSSLGVRLFCSASVRALGILLAKLDPTGCTEGQTNPGRLGFCQTFRFFSTGGLADSPDSPPSDLGGRSRGAGSASEYSEYSHNRIRTAIDAPRGLGGQEHRRGARRPSALPYGSNNSKNQNAPRVPSCFAHASSRARRVGIIGILPQSRTDRPTSGASILPMSRAGRECRIASPAKRGEVGGDEPNEPSRARRGRANMGGPGALPRKRALTIAPSDQARRTLYLMRD